MQHAPFNKKRRGAEKRITAHQTNTFSLFFIFHCCTVVQVRRNFNGIKTSIMFLLLRLIANEKHLVYEAGFNEQRKCNVYFFGTYRSCFVLCMGGEPRWKIGISLFCMVSFLHSGDGTNYAL